MWSDFRPGTSPSSSSCPVIQQNNIWVVAISSRVIFHPGIETQVSHNISIRHFNLCIGKSSLFLEEKIIKLNLIFINVQYHMGIIQKNKHDFLWAKFLNLLSSQVSFPLRTQSAKASLENSSLERCGIWSNFVAENWVRFRRNESRGSGGRSQRGG